MGKLTEKSLNIPYEVYMVPGALIGFKFIENHQWLLFRIHGAREYDLASGSRVLSHRLCWVDSKHI